MMEEDIPGKEPEKLEEVEDGAIPVEVLPMTQPNAGVNVNFVTVWDIYQLPARRILPTKGLSKEEQRQYIHQPHQHLPHQPLQLKKNCKQEG